MDFTENYSNINSKLDEIQDVMYENVSNLVERQEKLEVLVDKTDDLKTTSFQFQQNSKNLRRKLFLKKVKWYLFITFIVLLIMWIFSIIICGIDYSFCK